jgi:hypothetical protein
LILKLKLLKSINIKIFMTLLKMVNNLKMMRFLTLFRKNEL